MGKDLPEFLKHLPVFDHSDFYQDGRTYPPIGSLVVAEIAQVVHLPKVKVIDYSKLSKGEPKETLEDAVRTYSVSGILIFPDGKLLECSTKGYIPPENFFVGDIQYIKVRNINGYSTLLKL